MAAEPLTAAEWEAITEASWVGGSKAWRAEIERIVAARVAAARRDGGDERAEQIAQAIEALDGPTTGENTISDYLGLAARIARESA